MSEDARRLLLALVEGAMASRQTEDPEDVVGVSVAVSLPATHAAGIEGDRHYHERLGAALAQLGDAGALVHDHDTSQLAAAVDGDPEAYMIMRRGIELLREAGEL